MCAILACPCNSVRSRTGRLQVSGPRHCRRTWAKRQLEKQKIAYEALDNGFLPCAAPERLQQICDSLGSPQN